MRPTSARAARGMSRHQPGMFDAGKYELVQVLHDAQPRALTGPGTWVATAGIGGSALVRFRGHVHRLVPVPEKLSSRAFAGDEVVDRLLATAPRKPTAAAMAEASINPALVAAVSVKVCSGPKQRRREDFARADKGSSEMQNSWRFVDMHGDAGWCEKLEVS